MEHKFYTGGERRWTHPAQMKRKKTENWDAHTFP